MPLPRWFARGVVLAMLVAGPRAFADDAKAHVQRAMQLHGEGKYAEALDELTQAYALDPQPDLLYAIAQVDVKLDHCSDAIAFYEKFLASRPKPGPAGAAREAISVCKKKLAEPKKPDPTPEPAVAEPPPAPDPEETKHADTEPIETKTVEARPVVTATAEPIAAPEPPPVPERPSGTSPWYADPVGDTLVIAGLAGGGAGIAMYHGASSDLDKAEKAPSYQASLDLVDSAHRARTYALVAGIGGAVVLTAGVIHLVLHHRAATDHVAIVPARGGGLVTLGGRF